MCAATSVVLATSAPSHAHGLNLTIKQILGARSILERVDTVIWPRPGHGVANERARGNEHSETLHPREKDLAERCCGLYLWLSSISSISLSFAEVLSSSVLTSWWVMS